MKRRPHLWFKVLLLIGGLLSLLLLFQTVATYRYVERSLIRQEAQREADRRTLSVMRAGRLTHARDAASLTPVLHELVHEAPQTIAWIRLVSRDAQVLAESERVANAPRISPERFRNATRPGPGPHVIDAGNILIVFTPIRMNNAGPSFLETAIYLEGVSIHFGPLRQNLIVGTTAAFALLAAVIIIALRFPHYMRSKHVEEELTLARRVQSDLFPDSKSLTRNIDFSACCIPAAAVGGDLYDVFETEDGDVSLVLGDVSGKGLPAALLMGVVQGAVRAGTHPDSAERLNHLLCLKTARERFVSLFWCTFNPRTRTLRYVNAGHLPPLLIRDVAGAPEFKCLDEGGPVLGLLPHARYTPAEVVIGGGDILIVYSDGILESANASDEEFGEEGVRKAVRKRWGQPLDAICGGILADVKQHLGPALPQDDQTLLVARLGAAQTQESKLLTEAHA